jgi:hypothetical protein
MNILQTTVEKLLYILLLLMFAGIVIVGTIAYNDGQQIKKIINEHTETITQVKNNQYTNSLALETFIREGLVCTASIPPNPNPTRASIQAEANKCFPNTPEVK